MLRVEATGPLVLVEDAGRPGLAHLGLARSGAADPVLRSAANAAVDNPVDAAVLEVLHGGLVLVATEACRVAVAGDDVAVHDLSPGDRVTVEPGWALRQCVAVRGGVAATPVLGSRSRDTRNNVGPAPLAAGDVVDSAGLPPLVSTAPTVELPSVARVHPGPRADAFHPGTLDLLVASAWTVSPTSDRTAVRLEGPQLVRRTAGDLQPEGLRPGAVQVPPSGQPLVFGVDAPVTGGYPVIAVVDPADLRLLLQTRPGEPVRFAATW